jgi:hypothetical protein
MREQGKLFNLSHAVSINESLRQVIEISAQINIVAMNALLVAKRAGQQSAGFRVVAMELRLFSQRIDEMMAHLGRLIFQLVRRIAELLKLGRNMRILRAAMSKSPEIEARLEDNFRRKQIAYSETHSIAEADWDELEREIRRSLSLCSAGAMLSHNGRIEAAYGGSMLADMQQVADRIEDIMHQTISKLKQLNFTMSALL